MRSLPAVALLPALLVMSGCAAPEPGPTSLGDVGSVTASLSASERLARATQIRDAASANGITQGYLLAGIADAETNMSHCWSELTWACQGPNSADCGGGPVVAGAGDGPCSLRQGGLGMFQFDAGTFDDTLAREGDRVLSVAGNVAAAVDFVVAMVIRSTYVEGVDTRAQAIAWVNGVRVDNARYDPWIRTVTHYYNGCRPTYSCWTSRYAHYRDNTTGVHDEMGPDFWSTSFEWGAEFVSQSFPFARDAFELFADDEVFGHIELRNTGTGTWQPGQTMLATTEPRDGASPLTGPDWLADNRLATVDRVVAPGETGRFEFTVRAPAAAGEYAQHFGLVQESVAWFSDEGGPSDDQLELRVTVSARPGCPDATEEWSCDGLDRVVCRGGMSEREACEAGCVEMVGADLCRVPGEPIPDADGDGFDASVDCNETDAFSFPGAAEVCDDGIDQSCDGFDPPCGDDAPADTPPVGEPRAPGALTVNGGCSVGGASPGSSAWPWVLALGALLPLRRRSR